MDMDGVLDVNLCLNKTTGEYHSQTNSELL